MPVRKLLIFFFTICFFSNADAQNALGIGTTAPDASALVDLSNSGGLCIPRMTRVQRDAIASPATGLWIYQTDNTPGFYYNSGTPGSPVWTYMTVPSFWGDPPRMGFWGPGGTIIISNTELSWDTNNKRIGVGTIAPTAKLAIIGTSDVIQMKVAANATQTTDIMKIIDGTTGNRYFTFDNAGKMIVRGQGTTTSNNVFHLTAYNANPTASITSSFFEMDCDATTGNEGVIRLSQSDATSSPNLWLNCSRGNCAVPTNLPTAAQNSFFFGAGYYNGGWGYLTNIITYYRGSGTTQLGDLTFHTLTGGPTSFTNERMRVTPSGDIGINSTTFDATNPEQLKITGTTINALDATGNINDMFKFTIQNTNSGANASSDVVATNNTGTETTNYINLGINSSGYNTAAYNITGPDDGYLYNIGNNLVIGTGLSSSVSKSIIFFTGGTTTSNERMRITGRGEIGIGTSNPDASAKVDISSTTEGLLIPRMTLALRNAIGGPATGLLIFQTDGTPGFYYYTGAAWTQITSSANTYAAGTGLTLSGNTFSINTPVSLTSGGTGNTSFNSGEILIGMGTSNLTTNNNLYWDNTNSRLGIGTTSPTHNLEVNGNIRFGVNGTTTNDIIKATVTKDIANVPANTSATIEYFVVSNASVNSTVIISPSVALSNGLVISYARVMNTDTVEVKFLNYSAGAINMGSINYYISLFD